MPSTIRTGEFLDVIGTNRFKLAQLQLLLRAIETGQVQDGDVFFFNDLWFPGLEALFYVRDALDLDVKICGMLHAGTYDDHDYLTRCGMRTWGVAQERAWFNSVDAIFVATKFHESILRPRLRPTADVDVVMLNGFPMYLESWVKHCALPYADRQNIVVFPHRLAPEKQPQVFDSVLPELRRKLHGWDFVKTKDVCKTKDEYYDLLGRSKIAVSCALQETWGIAQQEATLLGCVPVVPDRLSYAEMYPSQFRYRYPDEMVRQIVHASLAYEEIAESEVFVLARDFVQRNESAVGKMVHYMRNCNWRVS
jgi:hypothetical protein